MERFTVHGRYTRWAALLLTGALLSACGPQGPTRCAQSDQSCMAQAYARHDIHKASTWAGELAKPFNQRVGPAPPALVDFLTLENALYGYPAQPRSAALDAAFVADVQSALAEIPDAVWKLVGGRLVGLYFVEKLGSTGYSGYARDEKGHPTHAYVVLDADVLQHLKANSWATWKENSPFKYQIHAEYSLNATIAGPEQDNRKSAIQYILLHELAHVIAVGRKLHPDIGAPPASHYAQGTYPFFDLSWRLDPATQQVISHYEGQWPQRPDVVYYKTPRLPASAMASTYASLVQTNFPTLYAATVPGDDFAESFASYIHTVRMGKPWSITLQRNGKTVQVLESCWTQERCAPKRKMLEALLAST